MCLSAACQALCCFGSGLCSCCCRGLEKCGIPAKNFPKAAYVVMDMVFMVIAMLVMYIFSGHEDDDSWTSIECNESSGGGRECFGTPAVLRASFVLFCFHILLLISLIPRG